LSTAAPVETEVPESLPQSSPAVPWTMSPGERRLLLTIVWTAGLIFTCGMTVADPDLWGHTLYGLRSIYLGVLLEKTDPFSYTAQGQPWVNHEWLTEYQFGWLWKHFGDFGLWMWRNVLALVVFGCAAFWIGRHRASVAAAIMLCVLGAETLSEFFIFVRPQLTTLALFAVMLTILRTYWTKPHRGIWLLPVLMAFWVNLHGGFLAGLGIHGMIVAAYLFRTIRERELWKPAVEMAAAGLLTVAATVVNPYGITMHAMLWDHLMPEQMVREWQSIWELNQFAPTFYVAFLLLAMSFVASKKWEWIDLFILAIVTQQALSHIRHIALLAIAVMMLMPGALTDSLDRIFRNIGRQFSGDERRPQRVFAVSAVAAGLLFIQATHFHAMWQYGMKPWQIAAETHRDVPGVPVKAIQMIEEEGLYGNLVTDYGWGQYVMWHLFPRTHVAFDGRYRTVYPADVEAEFMQFERLTGDSEGPTPIIDKYPTEVALLPNRPGPINYLMKRPDWVHLYHDDQFALLVRDIPRFADVIARARQGELLVRDVEPWQRFPAGPARWDGSREAPQVATAGSSATSTPPRSLP
jgi:hypothetical protein